MPNTKPYIWGAPPINLELPPHQVHVWRGQLGFPEELLDSLHKCLSQEEKERAERFHFPADRNRYIAAHGMLRHVLGRYLHCAPDQLVFASNEHGKPMLPSRALEFNLSHSGDFVLIAVTRAMRVGVDVESIRSGISSSVIAQRYFSKAEFAELQSLPLRQRESAFFTCWTRKEAYIKAQGLGLALPLESFDVSLSPSEPAILRATRPDPDQAARWSLFPLKTDPNYESAVAVEGKALELKLWDWNMTIRTATGGS